MEKKSNENMIVSAFLDGVAGHRSVETYLDYGRRWMTLPIHKTVFVDKEWVAAFPEDEYTTVIPLVVSREIPGCRDLFPRNRQS
jgi:hypothetical protein